MNHHQKSPLRFLPALFSLLLVLGSATLFSACGLKDDGAWMRCHSAQNAVTILGAALTVLLLLRALCPRRALKAGLSIVSLLCCIAVFLIPGTLMPMCMMHSMRCYTHLQPFARIMAALIGVCSLLQLYGALKKNA